MRAVAMAVRHCVARNEAAVTVAPVALAVDINEARAGRSENAVVRLRDGSGELTELADTGGVFHIQPRRVFGNRQNAAIAGALDAHEHDLFLGVDSEHLLAHGRHDGRAVVI